MKFKIGVFGSSEGDFKKIHQKTIDLGNQLSNEDVILITGASTGLPYLVSKIAFQNKKEVWGFSPATSRVSHQQIFPREDIAIYQKLFFVPKEYEFVKDVEVCRKYRNVTSTATCDAGIIISGRWGTMNEFTNLRDIGKVIGVLEGTEGIADELRMLNKKISKKTKAKIIFEKSPKLLVKKILRELNIRSRA